MTAGNIKTRTEIINEIQKILEEVTRKPIKICSFGSTSNGFGHKTSDLDICITNNEYVRFKKVSYLPLHHLTIYLDICFPVL